jgi:hypothetical protein
VFKTSTFRDSFKIESTESNFAMTTNLIKVDKPELLFLENPDYENLIHKYPHLKGVTIKDRGENNLSGRVQD